MSERFEELSRELTLLREERAILRLLHGYAHAMDYGDEAAWVDVFTPDGVFDVIEVVGGRRVHRESGRAAFTHFIRGYLKPPFYQKHMILDPLITVEGETARAEAYWLLLQRDPSDGQPIVVAFGRYRDRLVKQDGRWRIEERMAEVESSTLKARGLER